MGKNLVIIVFAIIILSACGAKDTDNSSINDTQSQIETNDVAKQKDDISPEFKTAMDSYEAFFDEYVIFMKKYSEANVTDTKLLNDYATYMSKYADTMTKFEALKESDMSTAEALYYAEVQSRIAKKLLEVTQ